MRPAASVQPSPSSRRGRSGAALRGVILAHQAESTLALGDRDAARELARQAVTCRGRPAPASAADCAQRPRPGRRTIPMSGRPALREGAAILAAGASSHNHFLVPSQRHDWRSRQVTGMWPNARPWARPLHRGWSRFRSPRSCQRALRALASFGRGDRSTGLLGHARSRLRLEAQDAGIAMALPTPA